MRQPTYRLSHAIALEGPCTGPIANCPAEWPDYKLSVLYCLRAVVCSRPAAGSQRSGQRPAGAARRTPPDHPAGQTCPDSADPPGPAQHGGSQVRAASRVPGCPGLTRRAHGFGPGMRGAIAGSSRKPGSDRITGRNIPPCEFPPRELSGLPGVIARGISIRRCAKDCTADRRRAGRRRQPSASAGIGRARPRDPAARARSAAVPSCPCRHVSTSPSWCARETRSPRSYGTMTLTSLVMPRQQPLDLAEQVVASRPRSGRRPPPTARSASRSPSTSIGSAASALLITTSSGTSPAPISAEHLAHGGDLRPRVGVRAVDDVQDQVRVGHLLQRRPEGVDELVRQVPDEARPCRSA